MKKVSISEEDRLVCPLVIDCGYIGENKFEKLEFVIPKEYKKYNKKLNFRLKDGTDVTRLFDEGTDNIFTITSDLATYDVLSCCVVFFSIENDDEIIGKSSIFKIKFDKTIPDEDISDYEPKVVILDGLISSVKELEKNVTENEKRREEYIDDLKQRVDNGEFNGKNATINGVSTLNIEAGENISLEQTDSTLTISGTYEYDDTNVKAEIAENTRNISNLGSKVDENTESIESNTAAINTNKQAIESNTEAINTNKQAIESNSLAIEGNTNAIEKNASDIVNNSNAIDRNTENISSNTNAISSNTSAIAKNTTAINENKSAIEKNTTAIQENKTNIDTNTQDINNLKQKSDDNKNSIDEINENLKNYSLITETGNKIDVTVNSSTYVMTLDLKDKNDNVLSTGSVDLPIESMIINVTYDSEKKELKFTLQNGNIIEVPLNDLISGLVTDESLENTLKNYALIKDVPTKVSQLENDSNYVSNTDYATSTVAGVVKTNAGLDVDENGKVVANTYNYDEYESKADNTFISKGTLEKVITGKELVNKTYVDDSLVKVDKKTIDIRNELERVKNDVLETGTDTDTFVHLEDSAMAEYQELSVDGVCEQDKVSLVNEYIESTSNVYKSNYFDTNITATKYTAIEVKINIPSDSPKNYDRILGSQFPYFFIGRDGKASNIIKILKGNGQLDYSHTFVYDKDFTIKIDTNGLYIDGELVSSYDVGGNYINRTIWLFSCNYGDKDGAFKLYYCNIWENGELIKSFKPAYSNKYGGCLFEEVNNEIYYNKGNTKLLAQNISQDVFSPNPDYPQEIKTIENSLKITSCNKNLFGNKNLSNYTINPDGTYNRNKERLCSDFIPCIPNELYSLSVNFNYFIGIAFFDESKNLISRITANDYKCKGNAPTNAKYVRAFINYVGKTLDENSLVLYEVMLVKGDYTLYEEHQETSITFDIPEGEFIGKIDDTYKDTLKVEYNEEDGQYHLNLYKRVYKNNSYNGESYNYYISTTARKDGNIECGELQTGQVVYYDGDETIVDLGICDMPITYNEVTNLFTDSDLLPQINAKYYKNFISTIQNLQVNKGTLKEELVDIENRLTDLEENVSKLIDDAPIYGIQRNIADNSDTAWERTDDAVGLVANATHDGTEVRNDFDNIYPWSHMKTVNYDPTEEMITATIGDSNFKFDGSNGQVMTIIPEFYLKHWDDGIKEHWQISRYALEGFTKVPGFMLGRYVSGRTADNKLMSASGLFPEVLRTITAFRTESRAVGKDFGQVDWRYFVVQLLYLVEYADYNSQAQLGNGYTNLRVSNNDKALVAEINANRIIIGTANVNSFKVGQSISVGTKAAWNWEVARNRIITSITDYSEGDITGKAINFDGSPVNIAIGNVVWSTGQKSGECDSLGMKSGCLANDSKSAVIYRGLENIFGNVWHFVDGINIKDYVAYVCYNPANYVVNKFDGDYNEMGYTNASTNGYGKTLGHDENHPLIMFPTEVGGSTNTYLSDYYNQNPGNRIALVGGAWGSGAGAGLWGWACDYASSRAHLYFGSRLLKSTI